jgi:hypothetical protein
MRDRDRKNSIGACRVHLAAALGLLLLLQSPCNLPAQTQSALRIVVRQGDQAIHNIRRKAVSPTSVQVLLNGKPLEAARVRFVLPELGPGGVFSDGTKTYITQTDSQGVALMQGFVPGAIEGSFRILAVASYQGEESSVVIVQQNRLYQSATPPPAIVKTKNSSRILTLVLIFGALAGVAGYAAVKGRAGTNSPNSSTPVVIDIGGITIGGPR